MNVNKPEIIVDENLKPILKFFDCSIDAEQYMDDSALFGKATACDNLNKKMAAAQPLIHVIQEAKKSVKH